jgi:hypothetical protein
MSRTVKEQVPTLISLMNELKGIDEKIEAINGEVTNFIYQKIRELEEEELARRGVIKKQEYFEVNDENLSWIVLQVLAKAHPNRVSWHYIYINENGIFTKVKLENGETVLYNYLQILKMAKNIGMDYLYHLLSYTYDFLRALQYGKVSDMEMIFYLLGQGGIL